MNQELKRYKATIMVELSAECESDARELIETIIENADETDIELKKIVKVWR